MAEEIIGSWKDLGHLFGELRGTGQTKQKYDDLLAGGGISIRLDVKLIDGSGQDVQFPLQLISNTRVERQASDLVGLTD